MSAKGDSVFILSLPSLPGPGSYTNWSFEFRVTGWGILDV